MPKWERSMEKKKIDSGDSDASSQGVKRLSVC